MEGTQHLSMLIVQSLVVEVSFELLITLSTNSSIRGMVSLLNLDFELSRLATSLLVNDVCVKYLKYWVDRQDAQNKMIATVALPLGGSRD